MHSSRRVEVIYKISSAEDLEELLSMIVEGACDEFSDFATQLYVTKIEGEYIVTLTNESDTDDTEVMGTSEEDLT